MIKNFLVLSQTLPQQFNIQNNLPTYIQGEVVANKLDLCLQYTPDTLQLQTHGLPCALT